MSRGAAPHALTSAALRRRPLPAADAAGDKESRGSILVVGGSREIPGAVLLAGTAALRAGAGKLAVATAQSVAVPLALALPEARVIGLPETRAGGLAPAGAAKLRALAGRLGAVVVGPGMQDEAAAVAFVDALLPMLGPDCTVVLDALAMSVVQPGRGRARAARAAALHPNVVLTPHAGEMAHLTGRDKDALLADPVAAAREAAARWNACVALKGAQTAIALPDGTCWRHRGGNAGLGTSGSGDTLAGVIAGLGARGGTALDATLWGVRLHALAGESLARRHGGLGYLAREILDEVPRLMESLAPSAPARSRGVRRARA